MCVYTDRMCDCGYGWSPSSSFSVRVCNFATRKTQIIAHEMLFIQSSRSVTIPPLQRSAARWRNTTGQISPGDNTHFFFFCGDHLSERLPGDVCAKRFQLCSMFASVGKRCPSAGNTSFIFENIRPDVSDLQSGKLT